MTRYDRNHFTPPTGGPDAKPNPTEGLNSPMLELFHASLAAHDLALHCNRRFSLADLYESGTWQKYEQRAAALARKHPKRDPFAAYLANDAHGSWTGANSRQSYRSALTRLAARDVLDLAPGFWRQLINATRDAQIRRQRIRDLEPHVDAETRRRMRAPEEALSPECLRRLECAVAFIMQVRPDPDHTAVRHPSPGEGASRADASKTDALYALNRHQRRWAKTFPTYNWRDRFWVAAVLPDPHLDDHRRACVATLMLTGCRPSELCDDLGVTVAAKACEGRNHLAFKIAGAKRADSARSNPGKGQEWRIIKLRCQTPEALWLFDYVSAQPDQRITLRLDAPAHDQKALPLMPTERRRRVAGRLNKLVARLGKIAFPRLRHTLSPYVFRHALSSDLRMSGGAWSKSEIAAGLGHQSTRTQSHYGSPNTSRGVTGSRAAQIVQLSASTPVRAPERGWGRQPGSNAHDPGS